MINGYSIRKCAEIVGISIPTSFYWRHKFLDAIRVYTGIGNVVGVIEVDESFKGNHKKGIYNIQHINAFHSKLKEWMYGFHSVSTKYLANYMYWFKWLQLFSTENDTVKSKHLLIQSHTFHSDTKQKDFKFREALYI